MHNRLMTITEAATHFGVTIAALVRMDTEGLATMRKLGTDYCFRVDELDRVVELAKDDPRYMKCDCIGGPCWCAG